MSVVDPRPPLTDRQREVLAAIQQLTDLTGFPPTIREIGATLGLASPSTVHHHVRALEHAGVISRSEGRPRARAVASQTSKHQGVMI